MSWPKELQIFSLSFRGTQTDIVNVIVIFVVFNSMFLFFIFRCCRCKTWTCSSKSNAPCADWPTWQLLCWRSAPTVSSVPSVPPASPVPHMSLLPHLCNHLSGAIANLLACLQLGWLSSTVCPVFLHIICATLFTRVWRLLLQLLKRKKTSCLAPLAPQLATRTSWGN